MITISIPKLKTFLADEYTKAKEIHNKLTLVYSEMNKLPDGEEYDKKYDEYDAEIDALNLAKGAMVSFQLVTKFFDEEFKGRAEDEIYNISKISMSEKTAKEMMYFDVKVQTLDGILSKEEAEASIGMRNLFYTGFAVNSELKDCCTFYLEDDVLINIKG